MIWPWPDLDLGRDHNVLKYIRGRECDIVTVLFEVISASNTLCTRVATTLQAEINAEPPHFKCHLGLTLTDET